MVGLKHGHILKNPTKYENPRDIAGNAEEGGEEEESTWFYLSSAFPHKHMLNFAEQVQNAESETHVL